MENQFPIKTRYANFKTEEDRLRAIEIVESSGTLSDEERARALNLLERVETVEDLHDFGMAVLDITDTLNSDEEFVSRHGKTTRVCITVNPGISIEQAVAFYKTIADQEIRSI